MRLKYCFHWGLFKFLGDLLVSNRRGGLKWHCIGTEKKKNEWKDDVEKQYLKCKKIKSEVTIESYYTGFSICCY